MKKIEDWPAILTAKDVLECVGCSRRDATEIMKTGPVINPTKKRCRTITRRALVTFLEGER